MSTSQQTKTNYSQQQQSYLLTQEREKAKLEYRSLLLQQSPAEHNLLRWLWYVLGIWIPPYAICPGHDSPLEYFSDRYYNRELNTLLWAARICGKSFDAGLECWLKGRFNDNWEANICAGSLAQATKVYKAADYCWHITDDIDGRSVLKEEPLKSITRFKNASFYEITTASAKAQRGPHPNNLYADEVDEMDVDIFNYAMNQTRTQYGHPASISLLSTMHRVGGLMSNWVDNASKRGFKLYTFCVLETMKPCSDYHCDTCILDEYCQGRMKPVIEQARADQRAAGIIGSTQEPLLGFNEPEDIMQKVRQGYEEEEETGDIKTIDVPAELFCRRPSRSGLVFGKEFNDKFHIVPASSIAIQPAWKKGRTLDFGYTDPFVSLQFAITPRNQIIFYKEFVQSGMTMPEISKLLKAERRQTRFEVTISEPAAATENATLKAQGIHIKAPVSEIKDRLDIMRALMKMDIEGEPVFIISSDCKVLATEIGKKYKYPDKGNSETPLDKDNHAVEAAGRAIYAWKKGMLTGIGKMLKDIKTGNRRGHNGTTETQKAYQESKESTRHVRKGRGRPPRGVSSYL